WAGVDRFHEKIPLAFQVGIDGSAADAEGDISGIEAEDLPPVISQGEVTCLLAESIEDGGEVIAALGIHFVIAIQGEAISLLRRPGSIAQRPVIEEFLAFGFGSRVIDIA